MWLSNHIGATAIQFYSKLRLRSLIFYVVEYLSSLISECNHIKSPPQFDCEYISLSYIIILKLVDDVE